MHNKLWKRLIRLVRLLTSVVAKLSGSKQKLPLLKAQGDNKLATPILVPKLGNKNMNFHEVRDNMSRS
jgi:E3 ubiquitin-protein ligase BRE1